MVTALNKHATKGNAFIAQLARELRMSDDMPRAYRVLKAVLGSLRNHISPEESAQFMAQLPMAIKSIYVDGWQIGKKFKRVDTLEEFAAEVYQNSGGFRVPTFGSPAEAENGIKAVFKALKRYVSSGELDDILMCLPARLRLSIFDYVMEGKALIM